MKNQDLIQRLREKATAVQAVVSTIKTIEDAFRYTVDTIQAQGGKTLVATGLQPDAKNILKNNRLAAMVGVVLVALYSFLYILLQLEDYALLMGSIGLFVVLTTVMYITRKIDWYSLDKDKTQ